DRASVTANTNERNERNRDIVESERSPKSHDGHRAAIETPPIVSASIRERDEESDDGWGFGFGSSAARNKKRQEAVRRKDPTEEHKEVDVGNEASPPERTHSSPGNVEKVMNSAQELDNEEKWGETDWITRSEKGVKNPPI